MLEEACPALFGRGSLVAFSFSGDIHPRFAFACPGDCFRCHGDPVGVWLWRSADRSAPAGALHATASGRAAGGMSGIERAAAPASAGARPIHAQRRQTRLRARVPGGTGHG